jgi:glutamine synthetase type III
LHRIAEFRKYGEVINEVSRQQIALEQDKRKLTIGILKEKRKDGIITRRELEQQFSLMSESYEKERETREENLSSINERIAFLESLKKKKHSGTTEDEPDKKGKKDKKTPENTDKDKPKKGKTVVSKREKPTRQDILKRSLEDPKIQYLMNEAEINSGQDIFFENYSKIVNIEALTMIEMASRDIIPAVNAYIGDVAGGLSAKLDVMPDVPCDVERDIIKKLSTLNSKAYALLGELKVAEEKAAKTSGVVAKSEVYCYEVIPAMKALRTVVDEMETMTASEYWPMPTYSDLMFNV